LIIGRIQFSILPSKPIALGVLNFRTSLDFSVCKSSVSFGSRRTASAWTLEKTQVVIGSGRRVCDGRGELSEAILRETPCVLGVQVGEFLQNQKWGERIQCKTSG